jgi:hypothetical protein
MVKIINLKFNYSIIFINFTYFIIIHFFKLNFLKNYLILFTYIEYK